MTYSLPPARDVSPSHKLLFALLSPITLVLTALTESPAWSILLSAFGVESPEVDTSYRKRASSGLEALNEKLLLSPKIK